MAASLRGLLTVTSWLLMVIGWQELRADELRTQLVARYQTVFSVQQGHSAGQDLSQLLHDTESYLSANNITIDDDRQLHQLFKKLSTYRKFFHNNHQRGLSGNWNYYRLMFDAIRAVDYRNITFSDTANLSYYRLLYDGARSHVWKAIRTYQEHFPFLDWSFCQEIAESCPVQQLADRWSKIEQLVTNMNSAIDHLNSKIEILNLLMRNGSRLDRQSAVRDYVQTYSETIAKPYGMLLFLVADDQHLAMVSAPRVPLVPYTLREFPHVDQQLLQQLFQQLQLIFATRLSKINTLYDKNNKEPLIVFLIKHHQQVVAEFVVNHPPFSAIIDHYLELVDEEYSLSTTSHNADGAALLSSVNAVYLVSLLFSRQSWQAFTTPKFNILAKVSLALGSIATYYMTCNPSLRSLCQQPALVESPRLQRHLQEMSWSLAMRQSNNLRYFLWELGRLEQLKDSATYQKLSIGFYATLLALRGVVLIKAKEHVLQTKVIQQLKVNLFNGNRLKDFNLPENYRKEFNLRKISEVMNDYSELGDLDLATRGRLIEDLFSSYSPFDKNFNWEDLTPEQSKKLADAGVQLAEMFSPSDDNVRRVYSGLNSETRPPIGEIRQDLESILSKTKKYIQHLFRTDQNESAIVSSI